MILDPVLHPDTEVSRLMALNQVIGILVPDSVALNRLLQYWSGWKLPGYISEYIFYVNCVMVSGSDW